MVYLSELQKETLLLVDNLIEEKKTYEEITNILYNKGYMYVVETKNGYTSKTLRKIYKNNEYSFVDIKKRKNGLATWETIKIS